MKLLERVREVMRVRHYSPRTETAYVQWIKRYLRFHGLRHPAEILFFLIHLGTMQSS